MKQNCMKKKLFISAYPFTPSTLPPNNPCSEEFRVQELVCTLPDHSPHSCTCSHADMHIYSGFLGFVWSFLPK